MSFKHQKIEWSVPISEVQVGISIGYEAEFSLNSYFSPILYKLTTYEENTGSIQGTFYYSLDDGATWIDFPVGEHGQAFSTAYKMRLIITSAVSNYVFACKYGTIYRIGSNFKEIIEQYTIDDFDISSLEIDVDNNLYVSGQNKTLYKISTTGEIKPGNNSINIHSNPLGISLDKTRNTFWQVDRTTISLKDLDGNEIFSLALPFEIDVDYSSSSTS